MLDHPDKEIINPGGFIYLAKSGDTIIGAAALIKANATTFELAKMVVAPAFQGQGISKRLLECCLTKAKELGANRIFLLSNSQLTTALSLYEKMGFKYIPVTGSHYQSADIMMQLFL
jgi:N-acetylglutamate synthase-like GNAT family acetyltransferase